MDLFLAASNVAQAFPVLAAAPARRRLSPGRAWAAAWGVYSLAGLLAQYLSASSGSNLWLLYFEAPVDACLALWALSCFSHQQIVRSSLRWSVLAALLLNIVLFVALENRNSFSIAAGPSCALIALAASLAVLVTRALDETEPLLRQDWFWISIGWALYNGALAVIGPISALLRADQPHLLLVYNIFQVVNVIAYAAVATGILCPAAPTLVTVRT